MQIAYQGFNRCYIPLVVIFPDLELLEKTVQLLKPMFRVVPTLEGDLASLEYGSILVDQQFSQRIFYWFAPDKDTLEKKEQMNTKRVRVSPCRQLSAIKGSPVVLKVFVGASQKIRRMTGDQVVGEAQGLPFEVQYHGLALNFRFMGTLKVIICNWDPCQTNLTIRQRATYRI